jgi:hypothetical protein
MLINQVLVDSILRTNCLTPTQYKEGILTWLENGVSYNGILSKISNIWVFNVVTGYLNVSLLLGIYCAIRRRGLLK